MAGVGEVDFIGKLLAVTGAAPGIGIEHHVACGGIELGLDAEVGSVGGVGSAVNLKNHGIGLFGIEARGFHYPTGNSLSIVG